MKKSIRCCISCILPCGALDVIRIVHSNGRVEELSETIRASDILRDYPKHALRKPTSTTSSNEGVLTTKLVVVAPEEELQRGKIYFLMPVSRLHEKARSGSMTRRKKKREMEGNNYGKSSMSMATKLLISDQYLSEILSEKVSMQKDRRRGRAGVWRPHLESIKETAIEV